LIIYSS